MSLRRFWQFFFVFLLFLLIPVIHVDAHAYLQSSTPQDGSHIAKMPPEIVLTYNESIKSDFPSITMTNSKGERIATGETVVEKDNDHVVSVKIKGVAKPDVYTAEWRVVSADGHPVSGVLAFKVGQTNKELLKTSAEAQNSETMSTILKVFLYTSFSLVLGVLLVLFALFPFKKEFPLQMLKRTKILAVVGISMMGLVILISLPVQISTMMLGARFNIPNVWSFFGTSTGNLYLAQVILWLILAILFFFLFKRKSRVVLPILSTLTLLALFMTKALSGHSQAQADRVVSTTADFLHLTAASLWVGGIIVLLVMWKGPDVKEMWNRFAIYAMAAFGTLLLSGVLMSVMNVGAMKNLVETNYGLTLLIKIGLVILMALLGLGHYIYFKQTGKQIPVKTILVEMIVGLVILSVAGVLSDTKTPKPEPSKPYSEIARDKSGQTKIRLQITPAKVGENTFSASFLTKEGADFGSLEQVTFVVKHAGSKAKEFQGMRSSNGDYVASGLYINQVGQWEVLVRGLTKDFNTIEQVFNLKIKE